MTEWHFLAYGSGKVAAYIAVCWLALAWVAGRPRPWLRAVLFGLLRAGMGLLFGVGIFFAGAMLLAGTAGGLGAQVLVYLLVYVPTRWVEWSLIALLAVPAARSWRGFVLGSGGRDRLWRLLGIVASCCADIPVLLAVGGLPIGRFMC